MKKERDREEGQRSERNEWKNTGQREGKRKREDRGGKNRREEEEEEVTTSPGQRLGNDTPIFSPTPDKTVGRNNGNAF